MENPREDSTRREYLKVVGLAVGATAGCIQSPPPDKEYSVGGDPPYTVGEIADDPDNFKLEDHDILHDPKEVAEEGTKEAEIPGAKYKLEARVAGPNPPIEIEEEGGLLEGITGGSTDEELEGQNFYTYGIFPSGRFECEGAPTLKAVEHEDHRPLYDVLEERETCTEVTLEGYIVEPRTEGLGDYLFKIVDANRPQ